MSANLMKGKALPIGIDLGTASLKMAQMKVLPTGSFSLLAAGLADVPPGARKDPSMRAAFVSHAIKDLLSVHPFRGRQCVLSLPAETTFVQHIKLAKMPPDQLAASLQWELQGKLPYDPSRAIIRHVVAGEIYDDDEVKQEVIVLAANRDVVNSHIGLTRRAKLDCVGINVEPCAIVECFARLFRRTEDANRATLFIDIGSGSTQVVISHATHLAFAKNLFVGSSRFDQAVADGMQVSLDEAHHMRKLTAGGGEVEGGEKILRLLAKPTDALAQELTRCLRYYESVFPNRPVERVVFLGGQAYNKHLCQALAQRLSIPAQIGDPLANIQREAGADLQSDADDGEGLPDWAVAVGLSLGMAVENEPVMRREEAVQL